MPARWFLLAAFALCVAVYPQPAGALSQDVDTESNAYTNVYLAVSPELNNQQCQAAVDNFLVVINDASKLIYNMTGRRLHFGTELSVVLPASITTCGTYTSTTLATPGWAYETAPLRLGLTHPLFGDNMWTQQPRQCGQPGDFIYLTPASLRDTTTAARRLAGEWAKYRWGVMDEEGHQGDPVYPPAYPSYDEGLYSPNACTDAPLAYNETECSGEQSCSVTLDPALNGLPTSSILSLPQLPNVVNMCTAGTHNIQAPSKQNALCNGDSAWKVFSQHRDYTVFPSSSEQAPYVSVRTYRSQPLAAAIVLAVETTTAMSQYDYQENFLVDSLCQAMVSYVQDGVYFGVMLFDATASNLLGDQGLIVLDADKRGNFCQNLLSQADFTASSQNVSVISAVEKATELLPSGGSIVLVTRPTSSFSEDLTEAVAAAGLNTVRPVIYAVEENVNTTWFSSLSEQTGGDGVSTVSLSSAGGVMNTIVRSELSSALYGVISSSQPDQLVQIGKADCNTGTQRTCSMQIDVASDSASEFLVSVFYTVASSVAITTPGLTCTEVAQDDVNYDTSKTFLCPTLPGSLSLEYRSPATGRNAYGEVVAVQRQATLSSAGNSSGVLLWATSHLRDLQYTNDTAPGLFVQVLVEGQLVLGASVTVDVLSGANTTTLQLRDDGSGADVTGSDGVYSTFLTGLPSSATRADLAQELQLTVTASGPGDFMPAGLSLDPANQCCGSSLRLPATLDQTGEFRLSSMFHARVTVPPPANLPPGRVTDLRAATVGASIRLSFTAPGADLDGGGTVSSYKVKISQFDSTVDQTETVISDLQSSGSVQTVDLHKDVVGCDSVRSYVVTAVDSEQSSGPPSNTVRHTISCSAGDDTGALAAGAVVGMVIGAVLLLIFILLLIYLVCNWEDREELPVWQCMTCALCKDDKTKKSKKSKRPTGGLPKQESTFRSPQERAKRAQEIRDVQDLYSKPSMKGKQQRTTTDGSRVNGGFDGGPVGGHSTATGRLGPQPAVPVNHRSSIASYSSSGYGDYGISTNLGESTLQTTLPINNVGIPVPDMMGTISDNSFEDDMLKPVNLEDDALYGTSNFDPYASNLDSYGDNLNSYGVNMDPYGGTGGASEQYPPEYSTYPRPQFMATAPTMYSHGSSGHSSPAFEAPRLNTEV